MYISEQFQNDVTILTLTGRLDTEGALALEERLGTIHDMGVRRAILDMAGVTFVNSTGLRVIARFLKMCQDQNCSMKLVGLTENVERAFDLVGLLSLFQTHSTLQSAIEQF